MRRNRWLVALTVVVSASVLCPTGTVADATTPHGGTVRYAEASGEQPTWIFPFVDPAHNSASNGYQFEQLMYRPLYWFGQGDQPDLNESLSLARAPRYEDDDTKVVIDLKPYAWSDGERLTTADVMFWLNMMRAEKDNWANYTPGEFPDNMTSFRVTGPHQITMTLNGSYSTDWFTDNELSQITPMPLAWDKTSDHAAPGSGGCHVDPSRCAAVYQYLFDKSDDQADYARDPLWQVVDGPWRLASYTVDGSAAFVPNPHYSGPVRPKIARFEEVPFTADADEYQALSGHTLTVGYVPTGDLPQRPTDSTSPLPPTNPLGSGYTLAPNYFWGWSYSLVNLANPTAGAIFRQPYVMQALQLTIDQNTDDQVIWRGYAVPTNGPVPSLPATTWLSPKEQTNPYPFSVTNARSLLTAHGWTEQNGVMTCTDPGTAADQCGAGVTAGQQLDFTFEFLNGIAAVVASAQRWQTDAAGAGIKLALDGVSFNQVVADTTTCPTDPTTCGWQISEFGYYLYGADPTGDQLFLPGAAYNFQSYSNPAMANLVTQTLHQTSQPDFYQYEDYVAGQLPGTLNESDPYTMVAYSSNLHGVTPINALQTLNPENWYFTH